MQLMWPRGTSSTSYTRLLRTAEAAGDVTGDRRVTGDCGAGGERGWVIGEGTSGKPLDRKAALTEEGRRLARKGR